MRQSQETSSTQHPNTGSDARAPEADAVEAACKRIAPTWPLDRFIAVNPLWEFTERPLPVVSAELSTLSGARMLMPRAWYKRQWEEGLFEERHLERAIEELGSDQTISGLRELLRKDLIPASRSKLLSEVVDDGRDLTHSMAWGEFVLDSLSQCCAAYFDDGQASFKPPQAAPGNTGGGLYASWRAYAQKDRSPRLLMGFRSYLDQVQNLPETPEELIRKALAGLEIPREEQERYLTALLLDINGWAAWCAYLRWEAGLKDTEDTHIVDLLAMRMGWEWLLHQAGGNNLALRWRVTLASWGTLRETDDPDPEEDWVFQRAVEIAYQDKLIQKLATAPQHALRRVPDIQAVFCIDVRSEVIRRNLEAQHAGIETRGFAGFFGLPMAYRPIGGNEARPQLPGLLAPSIQVSVEDNDLNAKRNERIGVAAALKAFKSNAISGFSFVEAFGLLSGKNLVSQTLGLSRPVPAPDEAGLTAHELGTHKFGPLRDTAGKLLPLADRQKLAVGILKAMGLTEGFARVVLLAGHGSETTNNPHASGLDCGACCGQSGEVNARVAAALLNDPLVREGMAPAGIDLPTGTHFLPALHNTTTEEVTLLDVDEVPESHRGHLELLRSWLDWAAAAARDERQSRLSTLEAGAKAADTKDAFDARARDWSQTRPEWGLADNAAFVIAPRARTKHLNLGGRVFLHDYDWKRDDAFNTLELLVTAPMVVAHWINFQYYASTVDNLRYGSGNKVLHNVVGGRLGVFEGNGGDLRIGLSMQSVHDGNKYVHRPLRLSVFIDAPRVAIDDILRKHDKVCELVDNEWLYLFQLADSETAVHRRTREGWRQWSV